MSTHYEYNHQYDEYNPNKILAAHLSLLVSESGSMGLI